MTWSDESRGAGGPDQGPPAVADRFRAPWAERARSRRVEDDWAALATDGVDAATKARLVQTETAEGSMVAYRIARFRATEVLAGNAALVADAFEAHDVPYFYLLTRIQSRRILVVSERHRSAALQALVDELSGTATYVAVLTGGHLSVPTLLNEQLPGMARQLRVFRCVAASPGQTLGGAELGCDLQFWQLVGDGPEVRVPGEVVSPGTLIGIRTRERVPDFLPPDQQALELRAVDGQQRPQLACLESRHIFDTAPAVDAVYTWVDGRDPRWLADKTATLSAYGSDQLHAVSANDSRYVSRDELRYSLRSLDMYADWIRHVYLVTADQAPDWLDRDNKHLTVVSHRELFGGRGRLPTFNSHAIETQLHHIEGLAENYLYLNDDVFFGRCVSPEQFVMANGLAKFFLSTVKIAPGPVQSSDRPFSSAAKNNRDLLIDRFGRTVTHKFRHAPHSLRRSVMYDLEEEFAEAVSATAAAPFRTHADISMSASLGHYYGFLTGRAVPASLAYLYADIASADTAAKLDKLLRHRDVDVFCLNDNESDDTQSAQQWESVHTLLQQFYPLPSQFEK